MTTRTRRLEYVVDGVAILAAVLGLGSFAAGDVVTGSLGVVGAVVLWREVRHG